MNQLRIWSFLLCSILLRNNEAESFLLTRKCRSNCCHWKRNQQRTPSTPSNQSSLPITSRTKYQLPLSSSRKQSSSLTEEDTSSDESDEDNYDASNDDNEIDEDDEDDPRSTSRGNNFSRNERWLEDATAKFLDLSTIPLGRLAEDDVVSITGLMIAWSRRRSLEAALIVEQLLKRIVDDMRAGNRDVHVSTKTYTVAIEAWGKSDEAGGAERAQSIHDAMIETYKETQNSRIKPTTKSYNTLILAWTKSKNPSAVSAAEKTLKDMLTEASGPQVRPDALTFATMLEMYARIGGNASITKAETLVRSMGGLKVKKSNFVYSALQEVYARSCRKDAPEKTMVVLEDMLSAHDKGYSRARPTLSNYNNVLCAYSKTPSKNSAMRAMEMLKRIEAPVEKGGYDVEPDRLSYFLVILTCSRCQASTLGANMAEPLLEKMEERSKAEAKRREELSIAAPPLMALDIECFNVVLTALSKSRDANAVDRIFKILARMEDYANAGQEHLRPSTRSYNTALNALSYRKTPEAAKRAEETLERMFQLYADGVSPNSKPDAFSYTAILRCYQGLGTPEAAQRGNEILSHMEELYESNILNEPPDTFHYTIVCSTWSLSRAKEAPQKCIEILSRMKEKDAGGWPRVRPNIRTFNAVLDCLSRSLQADRAEQLLYHMLSLAKDGDRGARPDAFSFNSVINAFIYSKIRDAGRRAESVLERGLEYAEEDGGEMLEIKSFTSILGYYSRQKAMDSPYRARYLLNRLISLYTAGHDHLSPHVSCFINVMESYASQRHREAGESSEEILRNMIKLQRNYNATHLEVNTGVMNCVLNSWAEGVGNDEAGTRAELLLDLMEKKSNEGDKSMIPNHRSYNLVIRTWSKSNNPKKAERALSVLQRAKSRYREKKLDNFPPEYAYSLVIHSCAFSANGDPSVENRAFEIAVQVMNELTADAPEPSSATYAWFFQVCGRLQVPESSMQDDIERIFKRCCKTKRVNDFVLQSFKQATSDALFAKLVGSCIETTGRSFNRGDSKEMVQLSHLPKNWIALDNGGGAKTKRNPSPKRAPQNQRKRR